MLKKQAETDSKARSELQEQDSTGFPFKGLLAGYCKGCFKGLYKGLEFPKIRGTLFPIRSFLEVLLRITISQ